MVIHCGLKHAGMLSEIMYYKNLRMNTVDWLSVMNGLSVSFQAQRTLRHVCNVFCKVILNTQLCDWQKIKIKFVPSLLKIFFHSVPCTHKKRYIYSITIFNTTQTFCSVRLYVGHLESTERLRIQPAQLFNFSWWVMWCVQ